MFSLLLTSSSWRRNWTGSSPVGAGAAAAAIFRARRVDLVVLHFFGGADADEVILAAKAAGVPFVVLNHYANDRFLHLAIRKHARLAAGVAGVNGLDLPAYVRPGFANLSDGIDTDFFRRSLARPLPVPPAHPIVLLPARVTREKGQLDLVRAAAALRRDGINCTLAFAGRVDSSGFVDELKTEISRSGLDDRVLFLGNLNVDELRDWYAASQVMAFPTYHHEGLGRVIVEAQAMETPVVAYATGGVAEGIDPGRTGFLLKTGDVAGLTAGLRELLASPELRASLGRNGRAATESHFSLAALADRHEGFYRRVIATIPGSTD
jgi:glycosyltransferase involved in cell wall biosynthesis